jgi:hypothetical protein
MVNLAFLGDAYAMRTSTSYWDYRANKAKIFFMVFFTIVVIVLILGFISKLFKKSPAKGVEPPMPSNHSIKVK